MSYRLNLDSPVPDALREVALERLERAARRLRDEFAADPVDAVHGARKDLKKTRALLRLARPDMPSDAYRRENRLLRDTAREMSAGRDADVMVETVDALGERFDGTLPKRQTAALRRRLATHAERARGESAAFEPDSLAEALQEAVERSREWPLGDCDAETLAAGASRAYRRGRNALEAAEADPSSERVHEWRKRVKDLWYHQRLLADAWPPMLKAYAGECDRLSKLLGDEHDLTVLADRLASHSEPEAPPSVDLDAVLGLIATRRRELQAEAFGLGHHVYAEKPKAHRRRLARNLAAARADLRAAERVHALEMPAM